MCLWGCASQAAGSILRPETRSSLGTIGGSPSCVHIRTTNAKPPSLCLSQLASYWCVSVTASASEVRARPGSWLVAEGRSRRWRFKIGSKKRTCARLLCVCLNSLYLRGVPIWAISMPGFLLLALWASPWLPALCAVCNFPACGCLLHWFITAIPRPASR